MHIGEKLTMIPLRALTIPLTLSFVVVAAVPIAAQPVPLTPSQLDQLVARIALYPDPLLAQVLTASTRWNEIQKPRNGPATIAISPETLWQRRSGRTTCNGIRA